MSDKHTFSVTLFYSYSHLDTRHRERMEKALALLSQHDKTLDEWSDHRITPGQDISSKIRQRMEMTDIFVFLISPHFLASPECMKEWRLAKEMANNKPSIVLIPVVLADCAWKDAGAMASLKALPTDGRPIGLWKNQDEAWNSVYNGIRIVVEDFRNTFTIRSDFKDKMQRTEFVSQEHINLQDTFVFPTLSLFQTKEHDRDAERPIDNMRSLLKHPLILIHGEQLSGKTALCRYIFLSLIEQSKPVLYMNLNDLNKSPSEQTFRTSYESQFHGDYQRWSKQKNRTVILDNLSSTPLSIDHVLLATKLFSKVIITLSTHNFFAYYRDDERLASFRAMEICPLTHNSQEQLIKKRVQLAEQDKKLLYGKIDAIENQVNSIIINSRILPRYPFYVLSIIQTYESFMPTDFTVTSYSHCYYVLVIAHLVKSGIPKSDDAINSCLNFLERLAFARHKHSLVHNAQMTLEDMKEFMSDYRDQYILKDSIISRLSNNEYGIVSPMGEFKSPYMYYFFLGRYLAKNASKHDDTLKDMLDRSYRTENSLTLIFMIHHTDDDDLIDEILLRTMCALDYVPPAVLDADEAEVFEDVLEAIPSDIISDNSVERERRIQREARDREEEIDERGDLIEDEDGIEDVNDIYRILKNNDILAQILKNRYGSIRQDRLIEIIETITDGGLRLIRILIGTQKEINDFAVVMHKQNPDIEIEEVRTMVRLVVFGWTMTNIEKIVRSLNKPEIGPVVQQVVEKKNTPAYDLIGYFLRLDTITRLTDDESDMLKKLWNKYRYPFLQRVISLRTQFFLNTHIVSTPLEQKISSILRVRYRPRLKKIQ